MNLNHLSKNFCNGQHKKCVLNLLSFYCLRTQYKKNLWEDWGSLILNNDEDWNWHKRILSWQARNLLLLLFPTLTKLQNWPTTFSISILLSIIMHSCSLFYIFKLMIVRIQIHYSIINPKHIAIQWKTNGNNHEIFSYILFQLW